MSHFAEPVEPAAMPPWKRKRIHWGRGAARPCNTSFDLYRWLLQDELSHITADMHSMRSEQDSARVRASTCGGLRISLEELAKDLGLQDCVRYAGAD